MLARERRAERGHRVGEPGGVAGDHVGVALGDDGDLRVNDRLLGRVDAVQRSALAEDRAFGAVEVLGLVLGVDLARAETDGSGELIEDREDDTVAESIDRATLPLAHQTGALEDALIGQFILCTGVVGQSTKVLDETVPRRGRRAELEGIPHAGRNAARIEHRTRRGTEFGIRERAAIEAKRHLHGLAQVGGLITAGLAATALLELNARSLREVAQRIGEIHAVVVDHEVDGVPAGTAGKALVERVALVRDHGHARRAVLVERAEPHVFPALGLQRHGLADQCHEIRGIEHAVAIVGLAIRLWHVNS